MIETEALQLSIYRGGPKWEAKVRAAYEELSQLERKIKRKGAASLPLDLSAPQVAV